jgi:hypothetical protein
MDIIVISIFGTASVLFGIYVISNFIAWLFLERQKVYPDPSRRQ